MNEKLLSPEKEAEHKRLKKIIEGLERRHREFLIVRAWSLTGGNGAAEVVLRVWEKLCEKTLGRIENDQEPEIEIIAVNRTKVTISGIEARNYLSNGVKLETMAFWQAQARSKSRFISATGAENMEPRDYLGEVAAPENDTNPLHIICDAESTLVLAEKDSHRWKTTATAVNSLSDNLRSAYILIQLGFVSEEVGTILGISAGAARKRATDARKKLQEALPGMDGTLSSEAL